MVHAKPVLCVPASAGMACRADIPKAKGVSLEQHEYMLAERQFSKHTSDTFRIEVREGAVRLGCLY